MATFRLPSYRQSHGHRYHPYGRFHRRAQRFDPIVVAAVFQDANGDALGAQGGQGDGGVDVPEDRSDVAEDGSREDLSNLERALHLEEAEKTRGLSTLVVELALAVTRALRRLCSA